MNKRIKRVLENLDFRKTVSLKNLLFKYWELLNKDSSELTEIEERELCELQDSILTTLFGPLYKEFTFHYVVSDTLNDEEETFIEDLCKYYFNRK